MYFIYALWKNLEQTLNEQIIIQVLHGLYMFVFFRRFFIFFIKDKI